MQPWSKIVAVAPSQVVFFFLIGMALLYNAVNFCCTTSWISHMYTCITSLLSLPPTPPFHACRSRTLSWAPWLRSSFLLAVLAGYIRQCYSQFAAPFFPHPCVCTSIPALPIGSSVPFFYIPCIYICVCVCVLIYMFFSNLFQSAWQVHPYYFSWLNLHITHYFSWLQLFLAE